MKRYPCGVCGKASVAEQMIFSRHTGNRYCREYNACVKRARRKKKAVAVTTA